MSVQNNSDTNLMIVDVCVMLVQFGDPVAIAEVFQSEIMLYCLDRIQSAGGTLSHPLLLESVVL